jgi:phage terminase large subunit-like protein
MSKNPQVELPPVGLFEEILQRKRRRKLDKMFPDKGPLRRELYVPHMDFFAAGAIHDQRLFLAANKVGKSTAGGFEAALHSTGQYPAWWKGKRFTIANNGWACNVTATDCRDINQTELMGPASAYGTGMIPADCIEDYKSKPSVPDAIEILYVRHVSGEVSQIHFKSYDQGRTKFQGRNIHWIWGDEEMPSDVHTECLLRLMTTKGIIFLTYTPVMGMTELTRDYLMRCINKSKLPKELQFAETEDADDRLDY